MASNFVVAFIHSSLSAVVGGVVVAVRDVIAVRDGSGPGKPRFLFEFRLLSLLALSHDGGSIGDYSRNCSWCLADFCYVCLRSVSYSGAPVGPTILFLGIM